MLLGNLDLLRQEPLLFFLLIGITALALLIAITVHEASHALAAARLGDNTAKHLGRLSLNPIKHLDPVGTLMLFLVGFGWGKPVPVNPLQLRGDMRRGMAEVSLFGPLSNVVVAGLAALPIRLGLIEWHSPFGFFLFTSWEPLSVAADILAFVIFYNLVLAIFNLIPLAPLDGFKISLGLLPRDLAMAWARTENYGPIVLLAVIGLGYLTGISILSRIIIPVIDLFALLLVGQRF